MAIHRTSLATNAPVRWKLKWDWRQKVAVLVQPDKVPLEPTVGPCAPLPTAEDAMLLEDVDRAALFYWRQVIQAHSPGPFQKGAIAGLLSRWQQAARVHAGFIFGDGSTWVKVSGAHQLC